MVWTQWHVRVKSSSVVVDTWSKGQIDVVMWVQRLGNAILTFVEDTCLV